MDPRTGTKTEIVDDGILAGNTINATLGKGIRSVEAHSR